MKHEARGIDSGEHGHSRKEQWHHGCTVEDFSRHTELNTIRAVCLTHQSVHSRRDAARGPSFACRSSRTACVAHVAARHTSALVGISSDDAASNSSEYKSGPAHLSLALPPSTTPLSLATHPQDDLFVGGGSSIRPSASLLSRRPISSSRPCQRSSHPPCCPLPSSLCRTPTTSCYRGFTDPGQSFELTSSLPATRHFQAQAHRAQRCRCPTHARGHRIQVPR